MMMMMMMMIRPAHAADAGLLLWVRRPRDIHRLLQDRRSAAAAPQQRMLNTNLLSWSTLL